jgi:uncharacterized protein (DUF983 family)
MNTKSSTAYSIMNQKCPRCHEGDMFERAPYSINFMKMNKNCQHCGLDFIQEPSFYFGAMYFSYAIQVAVFVFVYVALRYSINPDTWTYVIWMIAGSLVILPVNYRLSRVMWINLFVKYQSDATLNH